MAVAGLINCTNCGSAWSKPDGVYFGTIRITRCPNCGPELQTEEVDAPKLGPLPWAIPPQPGLEEKVSAKAALEELLAEVAADEKDWALNDRIDLAVRVEEERKKRQRRPKL